MKRSENIAIVSYCDRFGIGCRVLLGVKPPCEHRRLPDSLSKYLLKTRMSKYNHPTDNIADDCQSEIHTEDADYEGVTTENWSSNFALRSNLSWQARSLNLLQAKYEQFSLLIVNTPLTSGETVSLFPSFYNYLVGNGITKIIVLTSFNLRSSDPLSSSLFSLKSKIHAPSTATSSALSSAATESHGLEFLGQILYNGCPSFGCPELYPSDWLTADPVLKTFTNIFAMSRIPAAILGLFTQVEENDFPENIKEWSVNHAWRLATIIQAHTGVTFDFNIIENIESEMDAAESSKHKTSSVYL